MIILQHSIRSFTYTSSYSWWNHLIYQQVFFSVVCFCVFSKDQLGWVGSKKFTTFIFFINKSFFQWCVSVFSLRINWVGWAAKSLLRSSFLSTSLFFSGVFLCFL